MPTLTKHAQIRGQQRRIDQDWIDLVIAFGRRFNTRGAIICVIGRREIERYTQQPELRQLHGIHVVMSNDNGIVITIYRNREFKRKQFIQPRYRRHRHFRFA